jgi:hypothetical protein
MEMYLEKENMNGENLPKKEDIQNEEDIQNKEDIQNEETLQNKEVIQNEESSTNPEGTTNPEEPHQNEKPEGHTPQKGPSPRSMNLTHPVRPMSFFMPPVTNRVPKQEVTLEMLHCMLTTSQRLRQATERVRRQLASDNPNYYRAEKHQQLPFVIPSGVFRFRAAKDLLYLNGLQVIDIDHLPSPDDARALRDRLFADEELNAQLAFVSPSGCGVKLFVPYEFIPTLTLEQNFRAAIEATWGYLECRHDVEVDRAGSDIARGCLLAFDEEARIRNF